MVRNNGKKYPSFFLLPLVLIFFTGCDFTPAQRAERAAAAEGDLVIGIVQTSLPSNFFLEGVSLAIDEINQQGGLLGRKLVPVIYDDRGDAAEAERIARTIAKNKDITAVIGHRTSSAAIPASIFYEKAGILFISYGANDPALTQYSTDYTFRNIPTNNDYGRAIAEFLHKRGLKKTMVFHEREMNQRNLADIFKKEAVARGIEIVATRSYFGDAGDFKEIVNFLKKNKGVDSVTIFGLMPGAAYLLKELDEMDVKLPIVGSGGMDSPDLFTIAGTSSEGVTIPTVFDPLYPDKETRKFVKNFQKHFNLTPDKWAAQGYDAVSLFAATVQESGTTIPSALASHLRFTEKWHGVTGFYSFNPQEQIKDSQEEIVPHGDIKGKEIFFKTVKNGDFVFNTEGAEQSDLFNYIDDFTLRLPLKEPVASLDPGLIRNASDTEIVEQLFLGLTGFDPQTNKAVPELARKWERNNSYNSGLAKKWKKDYPELTKKWGNKKLFDTLYYFTLREDITWTDGQPVTAHDVLWAIERNLRNNSREFQQIEELFILKNAEEINSGKKEQAELGVYAVDEFSLVFELEYPDLFFPARVSLPVFRPLPKALIEQHKEKWTNPETIQTNGPYKPVEWQKHIGIFLKKNPNYFAADEVSVPEVRYLVIAQGPVGLAMYENDDLDIMGGSTYLPLPVSSVPGIRQGPLHEEYYEVPTACLYTAFFNTERPPFDQPLVRKAISAAIDRQLLITAVNNGLGKRAVSCTHLPADEENIIFDSEQAEQWLTEAGYPGGEGFPELVLTVEQSEADEKIAYGIQTMLKHYLHISVMVKTKKRTREDTVADDDSTNMALFKVCADYLSAAHILKKLRKKTNWKNDEFDQIMKGIGNFTGTGQQQDAYRKADSILCQEEAAVILIFYEESPLLVKPRVQGWHHAAMSGQRLDQCSFKEAAY